MFRWATTEGGAGLAVMSEQMAAEDSGKAAACGVEGSDKITGSGDCGQERIECIMGKITVETCEIEGLKVITPTVFGDARGYFMETYNYQDFKEAGIDQIFVQDNQSASAKNVLRGLHFQIRYPQDKLVRVIRGEVFDVAVDLRQGSKTYGKWFGLVLSEQNKKQFYIPKNFAHGFAVLSDYAEFAYKCSDFYHPNDEGGIRYDDPDIAVRWPLPEGLELIMTDKDKSWGSFADYTKTWKTGEN